VKIPYFFFFFKVVPRQLVTLTRDDTSRGNRVCGDLSELCTEEHQFIGYFQFDSVLLPSKFVFGYIWPVSAVAWRWERGMWWREQPNSWPPPSPPGSGSYTAVGSL